MLSKQTCDAPKMSQPTCVHVQSPRILAVHDSKRFFFFTKNCVEIFFLKQLPVVLHCYYFPLVFN